MSKDIFISYSTEDIDKANEIRDILESHGIKCWFAPEDLRGTDDFLKKIPPAIRESKAFLLLLSDKAQESDWVEKELKCAVDNKIPLLIFSIDNCKIKDHFNFIIGAVNRYDMKGESEPARLDRLRKDLKELFDVGDYDLRINNDSVEIKIKREESSGSVKNNSGNTTKIIIGAVVGIVLAAVVAVVLFFALGNKDQDGEYIIWAPEYSVALSGDAAKNTHYRKGEEVRYNDGEISGYTENVVWTLDFAEDGTFTIGKNGRLLGIEPGYNGIGFDDNYSAKRWEIVEAEDGLCYIRNVETRNWLEWYPEKDNWSTHYEIINGKDSQFLVELYEVA